MRGIALLATTAILLLAFMPATTEADKPLLAPRADKLLPAPYVKALPPPHPETIRAFAAMVNKWLAPATSTPRTRRTETTTKNSMGSAAPAASTRKVVLKFPQSSPQRSQRLSRPPAAGTPASLAKQAAAVRAETKSAASCTRAGCPLGGCSTRGSWQGIFRLRGG